MTEWTNAIFRGEVLDYLISSQGEIISLKPRNEGKRLKLRISNSGYAKATFHGQKGQYDTTVHRAVYESFHGAIPKGLQIDHIDGNRTNNCLSNLRAVTARQNLNFARKAHPNVGYKLSKFDVLKIREMCAAGLRQIDVANMFEVSQPTVSKIKNGNIYRKGGDQ